MLLVSTRGLPRLNAPNVRRERMLPLVSPNVTLAQLELTVLQVPVCVLRVLVARSLVQELRAAIVAVPDNCSAHTVLAQQSLPQKSRFATVRLDLPHRGKQLPRYISRYNTQSVSPQASESTPNTARILY